MKRLVFLLLILPFIWCGGVVSFPGGGVPSEGGGDCTWHDTDAEGAWNGLHSTSNVTWCPTETGTLTGGTIDGSGNLILDANDENLTVPITSKDKFDSGVGTILIKANLSTITTGQSYTLLEAWYNGTNCLYIYARGNNKIQAYHVTSASINVLSGAYVVAGQDFIIEVQWDKDAGIGASTEMAMRGDWNGNGSFGDANEGWVYEALGGDLVAFSTEPSEVVLGEKNYDPTRNTDQLKIYWVQMSTGLGDLSP